MKFASTTLFALTTLATLSIAAPAHAGGKECWLQSQNEDVATIQRIVDDALDVTILDVMRGDSPEKSLVTLADVIALESQIVVYSEAECAVLQRLQAEIEDMRLRAAAYVTREIDLFHLRQEILLVRLERAVATQVADWSAGILDDSTARATIEALEADAFSSMTAPQFGAVRERLVEAIELATGVAMNEIARMQAVHHFYGELYMARWLAAQDRLNENGLEGLATFRDVERVSDTTVDLFTLIQQPTPYTCGS